MKKLIAILLCICASAALQGQHFRNNFLGTYTGRVEVYDIGYGVGTDMVYVDSSATDTNYIFISDTIPWIGYDYLLYPDSTFILTWVPTLQYGYFYSNGDSIFIHSVHNAPYYREWHCGRAGSGINEISISTFYAYPNPAKNKIFVSSKQSFSNAKIALHNSFGQSVLEKTFQLLPTKTEIDLPSLPDGIYFLKIQSQNNFFCQKIIIQN